MDNTIIRDALTQIVRQFGTSIFLDRDRLTAVFSDFAPKANREKVLLKHIASAGLLAPLHAAANADDAEKQRVCDVLCDKIEGELFIGRDTAEQFVSDIAAALGWNWQGSKPNVQSAPKVTAKPTPVPTAQPKPVLTPAPVPVLNATPASDFNYRINGNEVTITKYKGKGETVIIPAEIEGKSVTAIGEKVFRECKSITSITIPGRVVSIGYDAFRGCTGLTSITIPDGVTNIGINAFRSCTGLTSITIPDSVTKISVNALYRCTVTVHAPNPPEYYGYIPDDGVTWVVE